MAFQSGVFCYLRRLICFVLITLMCQHLLAQMTSTFGGAFSSSFDTPSRKMQIHPILRTPLLAMPSRWYHSFTGNRIGGRRSIADSASNGHGHGVLQRNFALHAGGASIVPSLTSPTHNLPPLTWKTQLFHWLTGHDFTDFVVNLPMTTLEVEISVGHCWEFSGSSGHIGIRLAAPTHISDVAIYHISSDLVSALDSQKAPRDLRLWGLVSDNSSSQFPPMPSSLRSSLICSGSCFNLSLLTPSLPGKSDDVQFLLLSEFTNEIGAHKNVQISQIREDVHASGIGFEVVVLQVLSNWGSNSTCIYHISIHGDPL